MKLLDFARFTLGFCLVAAYAGCGGTGSQPPVASGGSAAQSDALPQRAGYKQLYRFKGPPDGERPTAGLIAVKGLLFGTTSLGGRNRRRCDSCGTVFQISSDGTERVLHPFAGAPDGAYPRAGLTWFSGVMYGTTSSGGGGSCHGLCGTVFGITYPTDEFVIYSFKGGADGEDPSGGLLAYDSVLYGLTEDGGSLGHGTVFSIDPHSGLEHVLYYFRGREDGSQPVGSLVELNGKFYGVTEAGGFESGGTVFVTDPSGTHTVLHSFSPVEGKYPVGVVALNGKLYGATSAGGSHGRGTIFSISPSGNFHIVHTFRGTPGGDGAYPEAPPIAILGTLYGTTSGGGAHGNGAVYAMKPSGLGVLLYSFNKKPDGVHPIAPLVFSQGTLYGTTANGGHTAYGTVFRVDR